MSSLRCSLSCSSSIIAGKSIWPLFALLYCCFHRFCSPFFCFLALLAFSRMALAFCSFLYRFFEALEPEEDVLEFEEESLSEVPSLRAASRPGPLPKSSL